MKKYNFLKIFSLLVMIVYTSYYYFTRGSIGVIKDTLIIEYQLTATEFGKISSAFALSYSLFQIFGGYLIDKFSLRYILPLSLVGVFLAQYIFIHSTSVFALKYSRYLLGLFFAIGVTSRLKYLSLLWSDKFVILNGTMTILMACTSAFTSSGIFIEYLNHYSWQKVFTYSSFLSPVLALLLFFVLKSIKTEKTEKTETSTDQSVCFITGIKRIFKQKEFIIFALYTVMISVGTYILIDGYGNNLLRAKFTHLNPKLNMYFFSLPATLNMLGNGLGSIYNVFACKKFGYSTQMLIHGVLNLLALLGLTCLNLNPAGMLLCFFFIGFSYMGQSIGFLWLKNNLEQKYQGLSFGILNFLGVFFGGAMVQRLAGIILDRVEISNYGYCYGDYLLLFKLLLIPGFLALLLTFFVQNNRNS